ncbi:fibronectin type III domain protein [Citrifermentans bemidjiense Bem]|uniref:Fibronectin type III domain protein n=1 Tax=Citrifermentans bemidjiense (strain ATCC BAA-1014 / DSM 16622 / JCM 12645 / Bem) TaxID=404380 RepID=B5EAA6_CITBB|nr:fibronectin type III domain-containing protein [Citrifermentans bemidjiense]ACH38812.1 fibronectin type III domain protein [Citrifermentans bemidjiense Bem]
MLRRLKNVIIAAALVLFGVQGAGAAILFSEGFDTLANWSPPQGASGEACVRGQICTTAIPNGFYDYRVAGTEACSNLDGNHNTLNINELNARGGSGKAVTVWNEPCYSRSGSWGSDGLLGVDFAPQDEVYVRYWIKFQPDWRWDGDGSAGGRALGAANTSPMQKFMHLSHMNPSISPIWDFFSGVQNKPRFTPQLAKFSGGAMRIQFNLPHSPLTPTRDSSASFTLNVYLGAAPLDWSVPGTGGLPTPPGDGQWHSFEFYAKMNSAGGIANGISKVWYDGALVSTASNVVWIPTGDDPALWRWNHAWIGGNNSNTYLPANEQWYAVDDFVVSTHYSGPPPPPDTLRAEGISTSSIRLTWQSGSNGATYLVDGYRIYYGTDPANLNGSVTVAASQREAVVTSLAAGTRYYFAATAFKQEASDANENESLRSASANAVTVDLVRPDITLAPVTSPTRVASQTLSGTVADAGGIASVLVKVGAAAPVAATVTGNRWSCTVHNLTEGANSIVATAQDLSGNESTASGTIMLDTHPPVVTVSAFITPTIFTSQTISGTVTDVGGMVDSVSVQVGNGQSQAAQVNGYVWSFLVKNLQPGVATAITVSARDTAGNESSQNSALMSSIGVLKAGDLSGDNSVGVDDAQLAMQMGVGMKKPDAGQLQRGDLAPMVGGIPQPDGVIDTGDALLILGIVTGMVRF